MSMYFRYIKESRGMDAVCGANGFVTYILHPDECYVEDVYISEESRNLGVGTKMMDEVKKRAREHGCKSMVTTVGSKIKSPEVSLMSCISYGFKISGAANDIIFLRMEI